MSKVRGAENRRDFPRDPPSVLRELRAMRRKLGGIQAEVTIQGPIYKACEAIRAKIDDLAAWLTGDREYFWGRRSSATAAELDYWRRWDAIERGDEAWPGD